MIPQQHHLKKNPLKQMVKYIETVYLSNTDHTIDMQTLQRLVQKQCLVILTYITKLSKKTLMMIFNRLLLSGRKKVCTFMIAF